MLALVLCALFVTLTAGCAISEETAEVVPPTAAVVPTTTAPVEPAEPTTEPAAELPLAVTYDLGDATVVQANFPEDNRFRNMPVRLNGVIAAPAGEGPYPVVVILHGTHPGCPVDEMGVDRWPCDPADEQANYSGFAYLVSELAARGYVALAPNINAENTFGFGEPVSGERLAQLLDLHLNALKDAATGGENAFGVALSGVADVGRLTLIGHSRGGEMANYLTRQYGLGTAEGAAEHGYGPVAGLLLVAPAHILQGKPLRPGTALLVVQHRHLRQLLRGINMAMQPFKMMVGDMVNEKQKGLAYSIQSFLCNAGSLAGYLFPFIFAAIGISNIAPKGIIPDSVIYSFYIGALILILCVIYTSAKVKEFPPEEYAAYHGITHESKKEKTNMFKLLVKAPKAFWTVGLVQFFCWAAFMFMWTYTNGTVALNVFDTPVITTMTNGVSRVVLDTQSAQYQTAGDWVGILFAVQAIGSVIWATIIPMIQNRKLAYVLSLVLGGIGFISIFFIHNQYALFASFILIGCAWAAMLALPFTILTNALTGGHMGTYLGLFNGTICVPQIVAASLGGIVLKIFTSPGSVAPEVNMLVLAGVFLIIGAGCVSIIKER